MSASKEIIALLFHRKATVPLSLFDCERLAGILRQQKSTLFVEQRDRWSTVASASTREQIHCPSVRRESLVAVRVDRSVCPSLCHSDVCPCAHLIYEYRPTLSFTTPASSSTVLVASSIHKQLRH
ncbi:hypothetical protein J6590_020828 [Homalodisca vitripennis]|nr:hypothetical protein J6590_020828 [Homalodisca vitripennis]